MIRAILVLLSFTACADAHLADAAHAPLQPATAPEPAPMVAVQADSGMPTDAHEGLFCCEGFSICDGRYCDSRGGGVPMMSVPFRSSGAEVIFYCIADVGQCERDAG